MFGPTFHKQLLKKKGRRGAVSMATWYLRGGVWGVPSSFFFSFFSFFFLSLYFIFFFIMLPLGVFSQMHYQYKPNNS